MRWDPAPSHTCQELIWLFSCSLIFLPQSAASLAGFLLLMCGGGKKLLLVFKALVSCSFKISHLLYYAFTFNLQQSMLFLQLFFLLFFFLKQSERKKKKKKAAPYPAGRRFAGLCFFFWLNVASRPSFPTIKEPTPRNLFCPGLWHRFLFHPQQRTLWGSTIGCHQAGCRSASRLHAGCFLCPGNCWKG